MFLNNIKNKMAIAMVEIELNLNDSAIVDKTSLMGKYKYVECFEKIHEASNEIDNLLRDL